MSMASANLRASLKLLRYNRRLLAARIATRVKRQTHRGLPESWTARGIRFTPGDLFEEPSVRRTLRAMYLGNYETPTRCVLEQYLRPGGVFVDIGANIGYFSAMGAGLVGTSGEVFAFEPVPRYLEHLHTLQSNNPQHSLTVNDWALGDAPGTATIDVAGPRNIGWNSMVPGMVDRAYHPDGTSTPEGNVVAERVDVRVERLDAFVEATGIERIDLIKLDVEGFEMPVLRGMGEIPDTLQPAIICEVSPHLMANIGVTMGDLVEWLWANDYRAVELITRRTVPKADLLATRRQCNLLFLPNSRS